ncbi:restriction endonuclease subunit S, partial [Mannheimia haemolytica]|nr:restriction endonuclease subunit S [Mannheimia haemolytica]
PYTIEPPFEIPESWVWVRLGDICLKITDGTHHSPPNIDKGDFLYITAKNIKKDGLDLSKISYVTKEIHNEIFSRCNPEKGDILYIKDGATTGVSIINTLNEPFSMLSSVALIKTSQEIDNEYLNYVMNSHYFYNISIGSMSGTGIPRITLTKLESYLVLHAAIQGKLTEQDPNDELASCLIERIKAEKNRLIAEKKLKKPKSVSEIVMRDNLPYEIKAGQERCIADEVPFEIPQNWIWVRLGEVGDWSSGATPNRHNPEYYNGTIPWLKTGDLNNGIISSIPEFITDKALQECSVRLNPVGSVLIAMYGATIGKLGILKIAATTNQACCACIPFNGIYNKFLFYYLMSQKAEFQKKSEGSGQPNISKEKIINYLFPLPPIHEQHRIVQKIEQLFAEIEKL